MIDGTLALFGYFQIYHQQLFWLQHGSASYEVKLAELQNTEALLDIVAYFSAQDLLVRRHVQERGIDYLLTDIVDYRGNVLHSLPRIKRVDHPCPGLHGLVYAHGTLLHASEQGIVQERIAQGNFKTFSATSEYVQESVSLNLYQTGLLVVNDHQVLALEL